MKLPVICVFFLAWTIPILPSCKHEEVDVGELDTVCFSEVMAIYSTCTQCHDNGEMNFSTYEGILNGITPYKPLESNYYKVLVSEWGEIMPPDKPLSMEQRMKLRLWIEQGAIRYECSPANPPALVQFDTICFNADILPVLGSSCAVSGCHDALTQQEELVLDSYFNLMQSGLVIPAHAESSKLIKVMTLTDPNDRMPPPPHNPISSTTIRKIEKWIDQGAVNSSCYTAACDTSDVKFSATIQPLFNNACVTCHSGANPSGGVLLNSYTAISLKISDGTLLPAIKRTGLAAPMPPSYTLTPCQKRTVEMWIESGYPDN